MRPGRQKSLPGRILQSFRYFSLSMMRFATFFPDISMPPKMGPILGVPLTAEAAMPQT